MSPLVPWSLDPSLSPLSVETLNLLRAQNLLDE